MMYSIPSSTPIFFVNMVAIVTAGLKWPPEMCPSAVTMTAIAAVDTALWDIRGKSLKVPVYELLGGPSRESVMVYGHAHGGTIDETVASVGEYIQLGYRAVRAQCGVPGVANAYGVGRSRLSYEPAEKGKPLETCWSTEKYLTFVPQLFARLRATAQASK